MTPDKQSANNGGMSNHTTITEQLRAYIENSGQTRYQIAKETGVSQASLSRFVSGARPTLSMTSLDALAQHLGLQLIQRKARRKSS